MNDLKPKRNDNRPPPWLLRFFRWYCHPDYQEDIEGDLRERFARRVAEKGIRVANWYFFKEVMQLFRPGITRPIKGNYQLNHLSMFQNYFKLSIRNLKRHKLYTAVSILGLALGLACFYSVFAWTRYLSDFDAFHQEVDNIYGIIVEAKTGNNEIKALMGPIPAGNLLTEKIPSVLASTFTADILDKNTIKVAYKEESFYERGNIMVSDSGFFDVFNFPVVYGDLSQALKNPDQVVLSKEVYEKIFKGEYPLEKTLVIEDKNYSVSAVVEVPFNSQVQFDYIISSTSFSPDNNYFSWGNISFPVYLRLADNAPIDLITKELFEAYINGADEFGEMMTSEEISLDFKLLPYRRIKYEHGFVFPPTYLVNKGLTKDIYIYLLLSAGIVIIVIAALNFINLGMVQVEKNKKTIFVMRLFGSTRSYLARLFTEISIIYGIALLLAVGLCWLGLQQIGLLETEHFMPYLLAPENLGMILTVGFCLVFITTGAMGTGIWRLGLLAEKFTSIRVTRSTSMHGGLVVLQFTISLIIILSAIFVFKQFQLMLDQDLRFSKDQIITIEDADLLGKQAQVLQQNLLQHHEIITACLSDYIPSNPIGNNNSWKAQEDNESYLFGTIVADSNFVDVYQLKVKEEVTKSWEKNWCIINTAGKNELGDEKNMGQLSLKYNGEDYHIKAVIEDALFEPLHFAPRPFVIIPYPDWGTRKLSVRIASQNSEEALDILAQEWEKITDFPFEYQFLDQSFATLYENEKAMSKVLALFSWIAGSISLMGLLAIALNLIALRTKEIAIRKVVGARIEQIVLLLATTFSKWLAISCLIAIPIAYFVLQNWLKNFAFRTTLDWSIFLLAGVGMLLISLLAVAYHTIKAAIANPVNALRNE